jgi:hypothetical protein
LHSDEEQDKHVETNLLVDKKSDAILAKDKVISMVDTVYQSDRILLHNMGATSPQLKSSKEVQDALQLDEEIVMIDEDGNLVPYDPAEHNDDEFEYEIIEEEASDDNQMISIQNVWTSSKLDHLSFESSFVDQHSQLPFQGLQQEIDSSKQLLPVSLFIPAKQNTTSTHPNIIPLVNKPNDDVKIVVQLEEDITMIDEDGNVIEYDPTQHDDDAYEYEVIEEDVIEHDQLIQDVLSTTKTDKQSPQHNFVIEQVKYGR